MPKPTVYITHKIPQAALDIIAAHCDYTMWEDEATPVPHDVLLRSIVDVDGVLTMLTEKCRYSISCCCPTMQSDRKYGGRLR